MTPKKPVLGRRDRAVDTPVDKNAVESFTSAVEPATQSTPHENQMRTPEDWTERAKSGRKSDAYNFRFNDSQRKLIDHAHEVTGKPIQRLIEEVFWPTLEDQYGDQIPLPIDPSRR